MSEYKYEFEITMGSHADNVDEAWNETVCALAVNPGSTPEDYAILNEEYDYCEQHGTGADKFFTDPLYWDCQCKDDKPYIHCKNKGNYCPICKTHEEDSPDSRVNEIIEKYDEKYDNAVMVQAVCEACGSPCDYDSDVAFCPEHTPENVCKKCGLDTDGNPDTMQCLCKHNKETE